MLKIRLGALPDTEVKIPHVPLGKPEQPLCASVRWSSQYGKMLLLCMAHGRHTFVKAESTVTNCALPLDDRLMLVKLWPYRL